MDIRRLEVFCKVLELGSFTKAAEALPLSQPTVSEHVKSLEEMLGEKLIDRLGREALPTPAGRILYQYARSILQLRDEAIQALQEHRGNLAGSVSLGASTIPGAYILPKLIGEFKKQYPGIQISLKISGSSEIAESVIEGGLELGLIGAKWSDRRIELEEIFSDELVLVVHPKHDWAGRGSVQLDELYEQPFILREKGSGTRIVMTQIFKNHGFDFSRLRAVAEMGSTEAVRQGIKAQIGIAILSRQAVEEDIERGDLWAIQIAGVQLTRPFYLIHRKNRQLSPICVALLDYIRAWSAETNGESKSA
ncbi:MAG: selenium metabolism-associated LysR family transcriptional regulator [Syntrophobacteraceae bacterium]